MVSKPLKTFLLAFAAAACLCGPARAQDDSYEEAGYQDSGEETGAPAAEAAPPGRQSGITAPAGGYKGFAGPDIILAAADNWKTAASYFSPSGSRPVVMLLHSIGRNKNDWKPLAAELARQGFGYIALDLRGHGASIKDPSGAPTAWRNFRRAGTDNEFNLMTRDIEAAISFLAAQGIDESRVALIGAGLGANLAVKFAAMHPQVAMTALLSPTLNASRDVLAVNPMRVYGSRPLLMLCAANDPRVFQEALILYNIAKFGTGSSRTVFMTAAKGPSWRLLSRQMIAVLLQWLKTPEMPPEIQQSQAAAPAQAAPAPEKEDGGEESADEFTMPDDTEEQQ
ncbi:MAG: alpha/beta fold hydrolase [Elusimicrobiales bacterium]